MHRFVHNNYHQYKRCMNLIEWQKKKKTEDEGSRETAHWYSVITSTEPQEVSYLTCIFPPTPITSAQHSRSDDISVGTNASLHTDQPHVNLL